MNDIVTINEEECIDMMQYDVLQGEFISDETPIFKRFKDKVDVNLLWLTMNDRELLIKYAPKLFNTFKDTNNIKEIMYKLAKNLSNYRFEKHHYEEQKQEITQYSHSHKKDVDKYAILQSHIESITKMIGCDFLPNTEEYKDLRGDKDELLENLRKAYLEPYLYLPRKTAYRNDKPKPYSKKIIENYLIGLKLVNKSKTIKEFIQKIENASSP